MGLTGRKILLVAAGLCLAFSTYAQQADSPNDKRPKYVWRGKVNAEFGSNFHINFLNEKTHNLGNLDAAVGFTKDKFQMDLSSKLSAEHNETGKAGGNVKIADRDTTMKADASVNDLTKWNSETSLNFSWQPRKNLYKAYYTFTASGNKPDNYNLTKIEEDTKGYNMDYSLESGDKKTNRHRTGVSFDHPLRRNSNLLRILLDLDRYLYSDYSVWSTGYVEVDPEDIKIKKDIEKSRYRQTPSSNYYDGRLEVRYQDKDLFRVENLNAEFALTVRSKDLREHMEAATYVHKQWRDSVSARENFRYCTLSTIPSARIKYKRGIYELDFTVSPEYFAYSLDGDNKEGNVNKGRIANLMEVSNTFKPWEHHSFILKYKRSDSRPEYQQICWFPRYSSIYANEIYQGNPKLDNSITTNGSLAYKFDIKRFSGTLTLSDVYMPRKIAKTYNNEVYEGKEYRVYTWINGGKSNEFNINLATKWAGKHLTLNLSGRYNWYLGYSASGTETRSSAYSASGGAAYTIKTWKAEANGSYQSGVNRSYYSMSSIIDGNIRVTKTFGDHISLYIFGQNLLDKPLLVETKSEDEKEIRYEKFLTYKRLIKIGVSYKF